jgi:neutral ceramidase
MKITSLIPVRQNVAVTTVAFICVFFAASLLQAQQAESSKSELRAGVAKVDITPKKPVKMAGYGGRKGLSQDVHDPLSARVVIFENNGNKLVLVSTDLIGFYGGTAEHLRKVILEKFELEPSELFLTAIHTHAGPSLTIDKEKGHPNNLAYTDSLKAKLIEVIREAVNNMSPVQVSTGVGHCPVGANRRELKITTEGESSIILGRNPYGPTDKEVLVMKVAKSNGDVIAAMFDYATHATCLGGRNYTISGDVLGLAEQFVEKILGEDVIAPAFAGASGNIDPHFRVLPAFNNEPGWIPEPVLLGTLLGEEVVHVFRDIKSLRTGREINTAFTMLELPSKPKGESAAKQDLPPTPLALTVARVGKVGFVGIGCEVLTEIGMAIKAASPFEHTFVITHCNGAAGYLAPEHLHVEGGYEIRSSPFAPQAADIVVKQAVKMLHDL